MNPRDYQKMMRQERILNALKDSPKRFRTLANDVNLLDTTLDRELKRLKSENKIEMGIKDNKPVYLITKKGMGYLKSMYMILYEIYEMQNRKTNYDSNYFSENDIKYSLLREIESPYVNYNSFIKNISNEYRELILKSIKEKYIKENEDKTYYLINKEELKGKHMIAFEVDFDLIRKNIEDSLKSDKEFDASLKDYKEGIRVIKEDTRNLYRHILLNEERRPIFEQENDREDDPQ
jgi:DNA-binding HxlR family transcriptional regulator